MTDPDVRFAVIVPAYRPGEALLELVRDLAARSIPAIVIVDDGSGPEYAGVFAAAAELPRVHVVHHAINQGKGAALKSGFHFALSAYPNLAGVVTADADGQHHPDDIERVAAVLRTHPDSLVLGSRAFAATVPLRSRLGNLITRSAMHALVGRKLADTQTGLRGIPAGLLPLLLQIDATGYEYELEMLIAAHHAAAPILEQPIRTIYTPGNATSHFNPIVDSMKIYFVLLRFTSVSLMTAALDNLVFYLVYRRTGHILGSQIVSRVCALVFQYTMLRRSVFHSRQRHRDVLPKFVGLLLINGAASYGAILWATRAFPIATVPAKLIVETLLFFVNFALQRSFVFRQTRVGERRGALWRAVLPAVLAATVGIAVYGFTRGDLFSQEIWTRAGYLRFLRYIGLYLATAAPILLMAPWLFVPLVLGIAAAVTALVAGPLAALGAALFLLSANALGARLLRTARPGLATELCATLFGVSLYAFLMTLTARLPVHYGAAWAVLLLAPIALDWPGFKARLIGWMRAIRRAELRSPAERASVALLLFILGMHWLVVLHPEISADGMSTHLAVATNIAAHRAYTIEPARIVWAVQPLGADWIYAIVYLLGGEFGARLINFSLLLLVEALLYGAVRRWLSRPAALFLLAVFASTPLAELVTGSLFVENFVAALVLGMMVALWRFDDTGERAFLWVAAVLAGTAFGAKLGAFAVLALVLPFAVFSYLGTRKRGRLATAAVSAALFLATAIPTYCIAWWKTGNPLFPYMARLFPSPLLPNGGDFHDFRFHERLAWHTPFDLTFYTHLFYEGQNGSFGFQYLILLPFAAAAVVLVRRRQAVGAATVGLGAAVLMLFSVPNARYVYCAMPLVTAAAAASLAWIGIRQPRLYKAVIAALLAATALNIWFMPSGGWYNKDFYLRRLLAPLRAARAIDEVAPYRVVARRFRQAHPRETVLLTGDDLFSDVNGDGYPFNWHSTTLYDEILDTRNLAGMVRLMRNRNIHYFLGQERNQALERSAPLRALLEDCTVREFALRGYFFARMSPQCEQADANALQRLVTHRPLPAGDYDDPDLAIRFRGEWIHSHEFAGPYGHTVSYTDAPGAEAEFNFDGSAARYLFTKAPNRGVAEILIDGESRGRLDLYAPRIEWQSHAEFRCSSPGQHAMRIRVTGRKGLASAGSYVDLDGVAIR